MLLKEVLDSVFANVGDCVTLNHAWATVHMGDVDYITDTEELLELGEGNKYVQGALILPVDSYFATASMHFSDKATREGVKWLEAHDVKPIYQVYDTYAHWHFLHNNGPEDDYCGIDSGRHGYWLADKNCAS